MFSTYVIAESQFCAAFAIGLHWPLAAQIGRILALSADQSRSHSVTVSWLMCRRIARFCAPDECTVRGGRAVQIVQLCSA